MDDHSFQNASRSNANDIDWMSHIDDVYLGRWVDPQTGRFAPRAACRLIRIADTLDGYEADLVREAGLDGSLAIVADPETWDAMGSRVAASLTAADNAPRQVIIDSGTHATFSAVESLSERLQGVDAVVAVGSGTINDLTKFVTSRDGRPYCIFGTAPSMDGYTSTTASLALESGLKSSFPAHSPSGVFLDIKVLSSAPRRMAAAGYGDTLCTSVARIDWWMSHRLKDSYYEDGPYLIAEQDSEQLAAVAEGVGSSNHQAIGWLTRSLVLSGLGVGLTGISNHGSMGEHQISHYIDCFAGELHPNSLHGQQVGVATLTMGRIQQWFIDQEKPPQLKPTHINTDDMIRRMGSKAASQCAAEYRKKSLNENSTAQFNERLQEIWPDLRAELRHWVVPVSEMSSRLKLAGGALTATDLELPVDFYREAVRHAHEMRNRFSFADLACDAGLLDDFAAAET